MKINYRLEIEYNIFRIKGESYNKIINYTFNSNNSIKNREDALNKLESYEHIFKMSNKESESFILSIVEIFDKDNIKEYTLANINLYYSTDIFVKEDPILLYGSLLESFEERMEELEDERKFYEQNGIPVESEIIEDKNGNKYKVIKDSPIAEQDYEKIKNSY